MTPVKALDVGTSVEPDAAPIIVNVSTGIGILSGDEGVSACVHHHR